MMERPVFAYFSIALLAVMGFNMAFNGMFSALISGSLGEMDFNAIMNVVYLAGVGIIDFILAASIAMGSGLAYKISIVFILVIMVNSAISMDPTSYKDFDQSLQVVLSLVTLPLLIAPRSMREFYRGWSLPRFTKIEV